MEHEGSVKGIWGPTLWVFFLDVWFVFNYFDVLSLSSNSINLGPVKPAKVPSWVYIQFISAIPSEGG